jgi:DnaK suppressor protein
MKAKELNSLRTKYVELRDSLIKVIENSQFEVDVAGDSVDKIQGASLLRVHNQLSKNNLNKLKIIERAIEQIDTGSYGYCEECEEPIGIKRLEAIPGCTLCISCAEKIESHYRNSV